MIVLHTQETRKQTLCGICRGIYLNRVTPCLPTAAETSRRSIQVGRE